MRLSLLSIAIVVIVAFFIPLTIANAATLYINSSTGNDTTGTGSIGAPYRTFTKGYASSTAGDTLHMTGTFTLTDAGETGDAITTGFTIAKNLSIQGAGVDQTIIQSASTDGTADRRVFTISNVNVAFSISSTTIRYGRQTSTVGGCIYSLGLSLNIVDSEIYNCRATNSDGGGIYTYATSTIIQNSALYNNVTSSSGGGISVAGGKAILTNLSIFNNTQTNGSGGGSGLYVTGSTAHATVTNSTITLNNGGYGGGISAYTSGNLYLKNTIVAGNNGNSSGKDVYRSSATITSAGYNIIGGTYFAGTGIATTTGDWTDYNNDGTYIRKDTLETGSLGIDTTGGGINDAPNRIKTVALLTGSIAIDYATTSDHGTTTVPVNDIRSVSRVGTLDIGSFEYGGDVGTISAPTTPATGVTFTNITYNSMRVYWTQGNGSRRVVFMKESPSSGENASPVDGTRYSANLVSATTSTSTFMTGDQIGSTGWYAIYDGVIGTSTSITSLKASTTYAVHVIDYNGINTGASEYYISDESDNPVYQMTYQPQTRYVNSSTGNDTTGDGTSGSPYQSFHKAYSSSTPGDTIDLTGTFTWTDAGETGDSASTGYTIAKDLVIRGQGADQTIIQATTTDLSAERRVFTVNTSASTTIKNVTIRYGRQSGSTSGGCISTGLQSSLILLNSEVYGCRIAGSSGYGGGIYSLGSTTITNVTISTSTAGSSGGGIAVASGNLIITNTTIFNNSSTDGSGGGGGFYSTNATSTITNTTITNNSGAFGGGVSLYHNSIFFLRNSIVAGNSGNSGSNRDFFKIAGTFTSNGYNILGPQSSGTIASSTGDWSDYNNDSIYTLKGSNATGTLNIATSSGLAMYDSQSKTRTIALSASSIAINNGTTSANNTESIPTTDQRMATRSGNTDIGAYEYEGGLAASEYTLTYTAGSNGTLTGSTTQVIVSGNDGTAVTAVPDSGYIFSSWSDASTENPRTDEDVSGNITVSASFSYNDTTAPTVSITAPTSGEVVYGTVIALSATTTDDVGVSGVKFYLDGTQQGSEDTTIPFSVNFDSTGLSNGSHTAFAVARDAAGNISTSSTRTFTVDNTGPTPTSIVATPTSDGATITWTTAMGASSRISYGLSSTYSIISNETDTSPRVTSHSITLTGLPRCALFHYAVSGTNSISETATSSDLTFKSGGCTGSATISDTEFGNITTGAGGTLSRTGLTITVPTGFTSTSSSALFQAHLLDSTAFYNTAGRPSGKTNANTNIFNFKALTSPTSTLSTFNATITIQMAYSNSDIEDVDEDTLWIYRYDGSSWNALTNCSTDTGGKTVTCDTTNFSDFAIFGDEIESESNTVAAGQLSYSAGVTYGCKDPKAINYNYFSAHDASLCKFALNENVIVNNSQISVSGFGIKSIFVRDLKFGSKGQDVKELQDLLIKLNIGPSARALSKHGSTTYFGALTKKAVIEYQIAQKIKPASGLFGPLTRASIVGIK